MSLNGALDLTEAKNWTPEILFNSFTSGATENSEKDTPKTRKKEVKTQELQDHMRWAIMELLKAKGRVPFWFEEMVTYICKHKIHLKKDKEEDIMRVMMSLCMRIQLEGLETWSEKRENTIINVHTLLGRALKSCGINTEPPSLSTTIPPKKKTTWPRSVLAA